MRRMSADCSNQLFAFIQTIEEISNELKEDVHSSRVISNDIYLPSTVRHDRDSMNNFCWAHSSRQQQEQYC
jgi:hypothetical protein